MSFLTTFPISWSRLPSITSTTNYQHLLQDLVAPSDTRQQAADHGLARQDLAFFNRCGSDPFKPVARNAGEAHHTLTPSFFRILVHPRINMLSPVLLLRYAAIRFITASFGHPLG